MFGCALIQEIRYGHGVYCFVMAANKQELELEKVILGALALTALMTTSATAQNAPASFVSGTIAHSVGKAGADGNVCSILLGPSSLVTSSVSGDTYIALPELDYYTSSSGGNFGGSGRFNFASGSTTSGTIIFDATFFPTGMKVPLVRFAGLKTTYNAATGSETVAVTFVVGECNLPIHGIYHR